jgi:hypothetical protein
MHSYHPAGSVSRSKIVIELLNKHSATCEFIRHLAPLTIGSILKRLPLEGRVHKFEDKFVYIETDLIIGSEKQKTKFKAGDIGYLTSNASICIFVRDTASQPMNPVGSVIDNQEIFESIHSGDVLVIRKPII